jgi:uncharacterized protein DUF4349
MRLSEDLPLDPEVLAELDAIDATLRGEAVDPAFADLAELALLVAADRPQMTVDAAQSLDRAIERRFADPAAAAQAAPVRATSGGRGGGRGRFRSLVMRPAFGGGLATLMIVAVVGVVAVKTWSGGSTNNAQILAPERAIAGASSASSSAAGTSAPSSAAAGTNPAGVQSGSVSTRAHTRATYGAGVAGASGGAPSNSGEKSAPSTEKSLAAATTPATQEAPSLAPLAPNGAVPTPQSNGRRTIQSAQLQLSATNARIDTVSQELFNVVGQENGIVKRSQVTQATGNAGFATFDLSIPSGNLARTLTLLSDLPFSHVVSRTDGSLDVNGQYNGDVNALGDARALRVSLLKQLAAATTQTQIDSIQAQLKLAEQQIASDSNALGRLTHQIDFSELQVQINAGPIIIAPHPVAKSSGGFGLGKAWHDSVKVITVAAGVSLIALAGLLPIALLLALIAWAGYWVRRRRREAALDAA